MEKMKLYLLKNIDYPLTKHLTYERISYMDWLFVTRHHNIRFNVCFPCLHGLDGFL